MDHTLSPTIALMLAVADGPCLPPPVPPTIAQLVQPIGSAPPREDAIYVLVQVAPHGLDIRTWTFSAIANPRGGRDTQQRLAIEPPHRISSPTVTLPIAEEPKAVWLLRVARPRSPSKITVAYEYARTGQTPEGVPCQNPPFRGTFPAFDATPD